MIESSDFGAAHLRVLGREEKRGGGARTVAERHDGKTAYIEETIQAGVLRVRLPSVVERWRDTGVIVESEYQAAIRFATDWRLMHIPVRYASASLIRIDRNGGGDEAEWLEARGRAEVRWFQVAGTLGPRLVSLVSSFLVDETSLSDLAKVWRTTVDDIRGRVIAALAVLAAQYGG